MIRMTIRSFILVLCVQWLMLSCQPDPVGPAPEEVFVKYYGGSQGEYRAVDLVLTENNEFIILASRITDSTDIYLIKADASGNQLATRVLKTDSADFNEIPTKIKAIGGNRFAVIGTASTFNGQKKYLFYSVINDSDSLSTISEPYLISASLPNGTTADLTGADVIAVENSTTQAQEYVLLGTAESNSSQYIYLSRRDQNNNIVWLNDKVLSYNGDGNNREQALALFEKPDGELVIVGSTEKASGSFTGTNVIVFRTTELGTEIVAPIYGLADADASANDIPTDVVRRSSIAYSYSIVGSTTTPNGSLTSFQMHISPSGDIESQHVYNEVNAGSGIGNQALAVARTKSNEFIVVGKHPQYRFNENDSELKPGEIMVLLTNRSGEHQGAYDQHFGLESGDDEANAIVTTNDGGVAVAATIDFGSGVKLVGLLKLSEQGALKK